MGLAAGCVDEALVCRMRCAVRAAAFGSASDGTSVAMRAALERRGVTLDAAGIECVARDVYLEVAATREHSGLS